MRTDPSAVSAPVWTVPWATEVLRKAQAEDPLLSWATDVAESLGIRVDVVGGWVRDRLLSEVGWLEPSGMMDHDLRLAGEHLRSFAEELRRRRGGAVHYRPDYPTASWSGIDGAEKLDLAAFRTESFSAPGSLPAWTLAGPGEDLARRDLSIGAMAWTLWAPAAAGEQGEPRDSGRFLDPYRGLEDLAERRVRPIGESTFRDDPSRVLRAARYAARLNFQIDPKALPLLPSSTEGPAPADPARLRTEWRRLCGEERGGEALDLLVDWGQLELLGLQRPSRDGRAALTLHLDPLRTLAQLCDAETAGRVSRRMSYPPSESARLERLARAPGIWGARLLEATDAGLVSLDRLVRGIPEDERRQLALLGGPAASTLARWSREVEAVPPLVDGTDLLELGWPPGPELGRALESLRQEQLAGRTQSRETALSRALELLDRSGLAKADRET